MAMSKKCFVFALCVIFAIIIGAVIFVVVQMKGHGEETNETEVEEDPDAIIFEQDQGEIDSKRAEMMCESVINGTEPKFGAYNHPSMYHTTLGVNTISIRVLTDYTSGDTYQKNSYWLTGDQFNDRETISLIRADACRGKIPVIVIKMRPSKGIKLSRNIQMWNHYQPKPILETWTDYDKKLNNYLRYLAPVPSLVILEPDLIMFTYDTHNLQYGWLNDKYKEEFYQRAQKVIKVMSRSWVYVDAGNAAYLKIKENMEHMAKSLLRLDGLRGFSINTAHFFNSSYNNMMARRLHCLTGLHYVTDTSRNGGPFSRQSVSGIEKCFFDPPKVLRGMPPGWSWGTKLTPRQKRWSPVVPQSSHPPTQRQQPRQTPPPSSDTISMPKMVSPPNRQQDPEGYNQWINNMRNNGAHAQNIHNTGSMFENSPQAGGAPQPQPNNYQPNSGGSHNPNSNGMNGYNDLSTPSGRVAIQAITPPPTKTTFREVALRSKEVALAIFRMKTMRRGMCLRREAVTVHDANVWIKAPGEADGRLYAWGTYHKCLLGHDKPCTEECRLIAHAEQRSATCGCEQTNDRNTNSDQGQNSQNSDQDVFFSEPGYQNSNRNSNPPGNSQQNNGIFFPGPNTNPSPRTPGNSNSNRNQDANPGSPRSPNHSSLEDLLRQGR